MIKVDVSEKRLMVRRDGFNIVEVKMDRLNVRISELGDIDQPMATVHLSYDIARAMCEAILREGL